VVEAPTTAGRYELAISEDGVVEGGQGTISQQIDITVQEPTPASSCAYSHNRSIVINKDKVGTDNSGTLPATGFPVLIELSGAWLRTTTEDATNGRITDDDGDDIIFKMGSTTLYHEIEEYDGSAATGGKLVAWVRIDSLSKEADTTITMYYGNDCVTSPTEDPANVWDTNFKGVWHLKESGTGSETDYTDSSGNNHGQAGNGTPANFPTQTASGKISYAQYYDDGTNDQINCGSNESLDNLPAITFTAWIKPGVGDTSRRLFEKRATSAESKNLYITTDPENRLRYVQKAEVGGTEMTRLGDAISLNVWQHVAMTWDGTLNNSGVNFYIDGSSANGGGGDGSGETLDDSGGDFWIGSRHDTNRCFEGYIDEVRISSAVRDLDWIKTEFNNQSDTAIGEGKFIKDLGDEVFACKFLYQRPITIDHENVGTVNSGELPETGFPVLISVTGDWLKTTTVDSTNGRIEDEDGDDIIY